MERVPWDELGPDFLARWDQGQHLAVFGPNGTGKSYFERTVVNARVEQRDSYATWFANKPRDPLFTKLIAEDGWVRIGTWPPTYEQRVTHKILFWPVYPGLSNAQSNAPRFIKALDGMMAEGNWVGVVDESRYWTEQMKLREVLDELWTTARSNGITLVAGAQGPSWINTTMREELSWGAFFRPQHRERAKDIADITGDRDIWHDLVDLREHEFILGRLRSDEFYITKLPPPK